MHNFVPEVIDTSNENLVDVFYVQHARDQPVRPPFDCIFLCLERGPMIMTE